jgi:primosomal protein N' (replication factor Y)
MIAEVAVNVPLRRTFDYRLPDSPIREPETLLGARVIVPFGTRLRGGILVGLKERSELPDARLKTIQQVTEGPPLFSPELLAFTRWVADYYVCGWGEVLEAALPSGLRVKIRTHYRLREPPTGPENPPDLSPPAQALIAKHGEWDATRWNRLATPEDDAWLRRELRAQGSVLQRQEFAGTKTRARLE